MRRQRLTIKPGYGFGYMVGANCSDGTAGKNYVSLVVNDKGFASRFAACLTAATGAWFPSACGVSQSAREIGAKFTPRGNGLASHLVVADSWPSRGTFKPEQHPLGLIQSTWVEVRDVRWRGAGSPKPFTLYSYRLDPCPGFLVNGHLARQPW